MVALASDLHPTVKFGTDGWRAIIGADFIAPTVAQVAAAAARAYRLQLDGEKGGGTGEKSGGSAGEGVAGGAAGEGAAGGVAGGAAENPTIIIGYDCRRDAGRYAALVGSIIADFGFAVVVSDRYCPTPTVCWSVFNHPEAVGGIVLTSSHNPAEYLGIKLRMSDGGASPAAFTDIVESLLEPGLPDGFERSLAAFAEAANGTPDAPQGHALKADPRIRFENLMDAYLQELHGHVDADLISKAGLRVVVDPLFGAGRGYLAGLLRGLGVQVAEVNGAADPSFQGIHPEPILPWVRTGQAKVLELGYDACFVTDGDADRIGAIDEHGDYVTSHRILALLIAHLVEDRGLSGRVIRTSAGSNLLKRQCQRLGLKLTTTPIGFKWIYAEMLAGDVLIGGEESGGMGVPTHVRERDGLLMALLLTEMMAERQATLAGLVNEMLMQLGDLEYARRDLQLTDKQKERFLVTHVQVGAADAGTAGAGTADAADAEREAYQALFSGLGEELVKVEHADGIKLDFASDAWLLARPSGTEPLVRVYAEAATPERVEQLLDIGCTLATG